ncbi:hypothetical protein O181_045674 [Austropuccinia psidii MF-1]|uniref:Uncharacterized protein n=1 Tax=Austropuccinia psidii MF-1 TaxID=1389203 RepID=A0A9Q3HKK7_9BASI|nr:hypothetical protein [Austropuccinia psidii MF-1]
MSPVYLRDLGLQRHYPEDREGLSRTRRPGKGHLGHSGGWQDIEGNHTHSAIHILIQYKPQTRGLEGYGSSSPAPPTPQRPFSMEHGNQEGKPGFPLGRTWSKFPEDLSQREIDFRDLMVITKGWNLTRKLRLLELSSGLKPFRNQQISDQESPFFTIPGSFQEKTRIQGQKQDYLKPKEERVRPNDPEAVRFGERSTQEPEVVVHNSRNSSSISRKITPNQIGHDVVTPESNLNSDALWLQMSQYSEQTQRQLAEPEASHERMKVLTASMENASKTLQEGHAQLSSACE